MMKSERQDEDELRKGIDDCIISYLDSYIYWLPVCQRLVQQNKKAG